MCGAAETVLGTPPLLDVAAAIVRSAEMQPLRDAKRPMLWGMRLGRGDDARREFARTRREIIAPGTLSHPLTGSQPRQASNDLLVLRDVCDWAIHRVEAQGFLDRGSSLCVEILQSARTPKPFPIFLQKWPHNMLDLASYMLQYDSTARQSRGFFASLNLFNFRIPLRFRSTWPPITVSGVKRRTGGRCPVTFPHPIYTPD